MSKLYSALLQINVTALEAKNLALHQSIRIVQIKSNFSVFLPSPKPTALSKLQNYAQNRSANYTFLHTHSDKQTVSSKLL